jgi:hypothetical protein
MSEVLPDASGPCIHAQILERSHINYVNTLELGGIKEKNRFF